MKTVRTGEEGMKLLVGPRLPRPEWGGRIIGMIMSLGSQVGFFMQGSLLCVKLCMRSRSIDNEYLSRGRASWRRRGGRGEGPGKLPAQKKS